MEIFWVIVAIIVIGLAVWLVMSRRSSASDATGEPGVYGVDSTGDAHTAPTGEFTGDVGTSGLADPVAGDSGYASAEPSHETYDPSSERLSETSSAGTSESEAPPSGQTGSVYVPPDADPNDPHVGGHPPVPSDAEPWAPDLPEDPQPGERTTNPRPGAQSDPGDPLTPDSDTEPPQHRA